MMKKAANYDISHERLAEQKQPICTEKVASGPSRWWF
jgi:hypothetical protein